MTQPLYLDKSEEPLDPRSPLDSEIRTRDTKPDLIETDETRFLKALNICDPDQINPSSDGWGIVLYKETSSVMPKSVPKETSVSSGSSSAILQRPTPSGKPFLPNFNHLSEIANCKFDKVKRTLTITPKTGCKWTQFRLSDLNTIRSYVHLAQAMPHALRLTNEMTDPAEIAATVRGHLYVFTNEMNFPAVEEVDDEACTTMLESKELPRLKIDYLDIIQKRFKVLMVFLNMQDPDLAMMTRILQTQASEEKLFFESKKKITNRDGSEFMVVALEVNPEEADKRLSESTVKQLMSLPYTLFR